MRRFTYACAPCGQRYERLVGGTGPPEGSVRCRGCGKPAPREWVAPQICTPDAEVEFRPKDMLPHMRAHDPFGRDARRLQKETDTLLRSKHRHARRAKREASLSRRRSMRHIGSIDAREMIAYNRRAGDKNAFFEDPKKALKRTGNLFDGA